MPMTDRRRFLTMLTATACGASSGIRTSNVLGTSLEPSLPRPCPPTAWKKLGTILAGGEQPQQNFTCPAESLGSGRWRIWYSQDPTDLQFYYLAVTHTPRGRIGLLGHYRVEAQTMDLEWCFSADGITWQRPERQAWLPRGQPGEADCYGIYASHALVCEEGGWHLFYTGTNASHNHKQAYGRPTQVVMHAITNDPWA